MALSPSDELIDLATYQWRLAQVEALPSRSEVQACLPANAESDLADPFWDLLETTFHNPQHLTADTYLRLQEQCRRLSGEGNASAMGVAWQWIRHLDGDDGTLFRHIELQSARIEFHPEMTEESRLAWKQWFGDASLGPSDQREALLDTWRRLRALREALGVSIAPELAAQIKAHGMEYTLEVFAQHLQLDQQTPSPPAKVMRVRL